MTLSNSSIDSFSTDEQGVEIRSHHVEEGDALAITQTDAHSNGNGNVANTNNTKGGFGNTALKVLTGTAALAAISAASYRAGVNSTAAKMNKVVVTSQKASAGKSEKSKAGKKVCLEYGFLKEEVIKGLPSSSDPLEGPTGALCPSELASCQASLDPESDECKDYDKCLTKEGAKAGPWLLNFGVPNSEAYFTDDSLCARITKTDDNAKTSFELWDNYINVPLSRYIGFKVDYDIISTGGNDGFVNLYVRKDSTRTTYYDCNFVFNTDGNVGSGTILIGLDTPSNSARTCDQSPGADCTDADNSGCTTGNSLQDYIDVHSGAVMGVGNGQLYTHVLTTGSSGQDNSGSDVCWKDALFGSFDENGVQVGTEYQFTLKN